MAYNSIEATTQSLYQQFLSYMKGGQKRQLSTTTHLQYKNLYSSIKKCSDVKKSKKQCLLECESNMRNSGCKFIKIDGGISSYIGFKNSLIQTQIPIQVQQMQIGDLILMQNGQKQNLQRQISSYYGQIQKKTKEITIFKKRLKQIEIQQHKFQEAQQLANNIGQFIDQNEAKNNESYNKMIEQQQNIVQKLKKIRTKAKHELVEIQHQFHTHQKQHDTKYKKLIKSCIPLQEDKEQGQKKCGVVSRGLRKFMESLDKVLELLQNKQSNFQVLKQEQCTKITSKKLNYQLLPTQRLQWTKSIQQFQNKFCMRVESSKKIIIKLFKQLKLSNQDIEKCILERSCLIEDYEEQLKMLTNKISKVEDLSEQSEEQRSANQKCTDLKINKVRGNSVALVQIMEVTNCLLVKFRYIFKLFIMMNIDKRRLSDQILKLQQILDKKGVLIGSVFSDMDEQSGTSLALKNTNASQLLQILSQVFIEIEPNIIEQFLALFFNDIRISLLCRKAMVIEQLQDIQNYSSVDDLLKILSTFRDQCEYNHNQKLKSSLKLLFQCFKCSIKTSSSVTSNRNTTAGINNQKVNNFLETELHLPTGMFPKPKIHISEPDDEQLVDQVTQNSKWIMQMAVNMNQKDKPEQWGKQQKKNPSKMIRKLLFIRNESVKKFKLLDLHECQKKYVKNSLKSMNDFQNNQGLEISKLYNKKQKETISIKSIIDVNQKPKQKRIKPHHEGQRVQFENITS